MVAKGDSPTNVGLIRQDRVADDATGEAVNEADTVFGGGGQDQVIIVETDDGGDQLVGEEGWGDGSRVMGGESGGMAQCTWWT